MKTTRINISIPPDLKQAMEDFPLKVNWSAIASGAFRQFINGVNDQGDLDQNPLFTQPEMQLLLHKIDKMIDVKINASLQSFNVMRQ